MSNRAVWFWVVGLVVAGCSSQAGEGRLTCGPASIKSYQAFLSPSREGGWVLSADNGEGRRLTLQVKSQGLQGQYQTGGLSENWLGMEVDTLGSTQVWFSAEAPQGNINLRQAAGQVEGDFDLYLMPADVVEGGSPSHLVGQFQVAQP